MAVVSSGLYGTISGSPTSDVVTTGAITIPMMKRLGYRASVAGAIEVAASTGGSLMPPVMGSAAFIMAEYTGIAYVDIAKPRCCRRCSIMSGICPGALPRRPLGLGPRPEQIPKSSTTLRKGGLFIVPLAVLVWALIAGYTPTMVAVFGTLAVIAVAMCAPRPASAPSGLRVLAETSMRMVPVTGACAAAGLVIGGLTMTGLSGKFAHLVYLLTGAACVPDAGVAAALTILLGMGMPTPSAYILAAVLIGPLLGLHRPAARPHVPALFRGDVGADAAGGGGGLCGLGDRRSQSARDRRPRGQVGVRRLGGAVHLRLRPRTVVGGPAVAERDHFRHWCRGAECSGDGDRGLWPVCRMVEPIFDPHSRALHGHSILRVDRRRACDRGGLSRPTGCASRRARVASGARSRLLPCAPERSLSGYWRIADV